MFHFLFSDCLQLIKSIYIQLTQSLGSRLEEEYLSPSQGMLFQMCWVLLVVPEVKRVVRQGQLERGQLLSPELTLPQGLHMCVYIYMQYIKPYIHIWIFYTCVHMCVCTHVYLYVQCICVYILCV